MGLANLGQRTAISVQDFDAQMIMPPPEAALSSVHKSIHFYQDMIAVGNTIFLLRDRVIIVFDSFTQTVSTKFFSKQRVVGLYKLKNMVDDS